MTYNSKQFESVLFQDSYFSSCRWDGTALKMNVRDAFVKKGTLEGYDKDTTLPASNLIFRGFRLVKVIKAVEQELYVNEDWKYIPGRVYEGREAEELLLDTFQKPLVPLSLHPCASAWVLGCGTVDIFFEFDEVEISWDSFLCPA